jgi:hypothetical protein
LGGGFSHAPRFYDGEKNVQIAELEPPPNTVRPLHAGPHS